MSAEETSAIKLMNHDVCDWPLWNDTGMLRRGDLPLPEQLQEDLAERATQVNDHADPFDGWDDATIAAEGSRLPTG